jgi:folate-binding protein YgfZ
MVEASGSSSSFYALARDTLVVRGPDRKTWLDGILSCAVTAVVPGSAGYGLLLTKQGKIVTDAFLVDTGAELYLGVAPGQGGALLALLDRYLVMEDAELEQVTNERFWRVAAADAARGRAETELGHGTLVLGRLQAELSLAGEPGPSLPDAAELFAAHGLGVFGVDFGERDNPHEASLDRIAVSWTKGCYLGQEVVCMQDMRGKVKRRLTALDGSAELLQPLGAEPAEVKAADGSVVGQVSSVHQGPGGARLLASISASALESHSALNVRGVPLRVAFGEEPKLG